MVLGNMYTPAAPLAALIPDAALDRAFGDGERQMERVCSLWDRLFWARGSAYFQHAEAAAAATGAAATGAAAAAQSTAEPGDWPVDWRRPWSTWPRARLAAAFDASTLGSALEIGRAHV